MGKIVRVLYYYPGLNFDTGSPKALAQFIESLDRTIFQPVFCTLGEGPLTKALRSFGVEIVPGGAASISYRHPLAAVASIRKQAALLREWKIDILHANGFFWNTDLILAAAMLKIPVVLHVHNPQVVEFQNLDRFAASKVLFCSRAEMNNCRHIERLGGRTEVLYNAINVAALARGKSIRTQLGIEEGQTAIGMVGQVVHRKGVDIFIDTARILLRERQDLVFLVAGPTMDEQDFGQAMHRAVEEPELKGRVRLLGSRSDIADFLASLDLFLFPTRAEPFGLVVIEAMAAGLPVIASKVGGIPEIVSSEALGFLVDPVTPEAFASAATKVLDLPDRGRSVGAKARESLAARFDVAVASKRLTEIYLGLLKGKAGQAR